jgi:hypothetical protein
VQSALHQFKHPHVSLAAVHDTCRAVSLNAAQVCILGGGFGGLCTAVSLDSRAWPGGRRPEITLVHQHERFVFKPLMYELLSHRATDQEVRAFRPRCCWRAAVSLLSIAGCCLAKSAVNCEGTQPAVSYLVPGKLL